MPTRSMERLVCQGQTAQLCAFVSFRRRRGGAEEAIYRENLHPKRVMVWLGRSRLNHTE